MGNRNATIECVENTVSIHFKDTNGQKPIFLAAISGNLQYIHILLTNGADKTDTDKNQATPLVHD